MRLKQVLLLGSLFPFLLAVTLFFGVLVSADNDDSGGNYSSGITGMNLSGRSVETSANGGKVCQRIRYIRICQCATCYHSSGKRGGTAEDVMQSSESLGLPPNSLDTESSIKQGCKYFASLLSSCKEQGITDINVAIQSYNFGGGYVGYVAGNGKKHTYNLAENFAKDKSGGKKVTYTNPIAVKKNGGWR